MDQARDEYLTHGMLNAWGKTAEELVAMDIAYKKAAIKYATAQDEYNDALEKLIKKGDNVQNTVGPNGRE